MPAGDLREVVPVVGAALERRTDHRGDELRAGAEALEREAATLTAREEEILRLVSSGLANKEVARLLDVQERTVKHHMTQILQKLHLRNRTEAALLAQKRWGDG